jgi:hypothetical protein
MTHTLTPQWTPYVLMVGVCLFILYILFKRA